MRSYGEQLEQVQRDYDRNQNRLGVEHMRAVERHRKSNTRESVTRALAAALREGLHATPDAFSPTRLSAETVDAFAEKWAREIL